MTTPKTRRAGRLVPVPAPCPHKPDTPENRARFIATFPLGRLSEPRDVASAAVYLASDEADFITGTVFEVDGGRTI